MAAESDVDPGGPLLNPFGLAKDIKNAHEWKPKEIKNGAHNFFDTLDYVAVILVMVLD